MKKLLASIMLICLLLPTVLAVDWDQDISDEDRETFDNILEPVLRIYQFIKYGLTALAVLFMLFAAATFIMNGRDQAKRDSAKTMMMYIVIGLVVIWVAPLVVEFVAG